MKIKTVTLLILASIVFLVSCQTTPEDTIVFNKNENDLEEALRNKNTANGVAESEKLIHEEFSSSDGYVFIIINSELEVSGNGVYPVWLVCPHFFSNADIEEVASTLFNDQQLYLYAINEDILEKDILMYKADLTSLKKDGRYSNIHKGSNAGELVNDPEEEIKMIENKLKQLENEYSRATSERTPIVDLELNNEQEGISSLTVMDGQKPPALFSVYNSESANLSMIHYENYQGRTYTIDNTANDDEVVLALSRADAEKQAVNITKGLCKDNMEISSTKIMKSDDGQYCYLIKMARLIDKAPCYYIDSYDGTTAFGIDGSEYREPWQAEKISMMIDANGIIGFEWINPPQVIDVVNDSVAILSIKEIAASAVSYLQRSLSNEMINDQKKNVVIDSVILHMMRIAKKDSSGEYYYIPVFDFLGYYEGESSDNLSFLTINAIDGSRIDRGLGY